MRVYVEGGSRGPLATKCRQGFSEFFKNAGLAGHMPSVVSCGSRDDAFNRFCTALNGSKSEAMPILLVDSEDPVRTSGTTWEHLRSREGWKRPDDVQKEQAHLMVQCMETWFLADVSTLEDFFGSGFQSSAIADRNDIENILKSDVLRQLNSASRNSKRGAYHKGRHSFDILALIDPAQVTQRSGFARQLVKTLKQHLFSS